MWEYLVIAIGLLSLLTAFVFAIYVKRRDQGEGLMVEIAGYIRHGAMTFLNEEYKYLTAYIIVVSILLYVGSLFSNGISEYTWISFVFGAILSALAGNVGMRIATLANVRTAKAVEKDTHSGLKVAFSSGAVMGLTVVGLGLTGVSVIYLIFRSISPNDLSNILFGFGFGASSIALFARVGGGIYTKAADVGADLVGKVEAGIPEDDPRNPAVIADNVGDNVGDTAGMGADLFESYVDSIIATIAIGVMMLSAVVGDVIILPLLIAGIGIISSIIGILTVVGLRNEDPSKAMNTGVIVSAVVMVILAGLTIYYLGPSGFQIFNRTVPWYYLFVALISGLLAGIVIGFATEYYTSDKYKPTQEIAQASTTGAATNLITGMAVGMLSTLIPIITVGFAILIAYYLADLYGIAIAAVGMLSTLGMTLSMDTYGPVADNAAGIAEMAHLGKEVRERAEGLDAIGNTTAAIGKGFAIGSAALTALALFATYTNSFPAGITMDISDPAVTVGIFIGALMPFLFSALALKAVGKAAEDMVNEVRRQFREIDGILEGKAKPDYNRCVAISTEAAIKKMILPTLLAIVVPIVVGVIPGLGAKAVGGVLAGSIASGFLLAIYMANAGGAWDNAKKYIEKGNLGGKGSDAHKAAVVGDTVGDPLKDTAGPSLNILIKLMSIVSLIFASFFVL